MNAGQKFGVRESDDIDLSASMEQEVQLNGDDDFDVKNQNEIDIELEIEVDEARIKAELEKPITESDISPGLSKTKGVEVEVVVDKTSKKQSTFDPKMKAKMAKYRESMKNKLGKGGEKMGKASKSLKKNMKAASTRTKESWKKNTTAFKDGLKGFNTNTDKKCLCCLIVLTIIMWLVFIAYLCFEIYILDTSKIHNKFFHNTYKRCAAFIISLIIGIIMLLITCCCCIKCCDGNRTRKQDMEKSVVKPKKKNLQVTIDESQNVTMDFDASDISPQYKKEKAKKEGAYPRQQLLEVSELYSENSKSENDINVGIELQPTSLQHSDINDQEVIVEFEIA